MDNKAQLHEIKRYHRHLCRLVGYPVDLESAAYLWIRLYARSWRRTHPHSAFVQP